MHSSRMRTVHCSGRLGGGGSAQGGICLQGVSAWGCLPRGCTPPPVDRMTENITFPQLLLQTVNMRARCRISMVLYLMSFYCVFRHMTTNLQGTDYPKLTPPGYMQ